MSYTALSMSIHELVRDIERYFLPAIQREFVWSAEQIESLFDSLLRGYPIGVMLRWDVRKPAIHDFEFYRLLTDYDERTPHNHKADLSIREQCYGILDGQQRITSLCIGLVGSYTEKLPRRRWTNPDAFPKKRLYINLLYQPQEDSDQRFQIKFLTEKQSQQTEQVAWFRVGEILKYKTKDELRAFRRGTPHRDSDVFVDNLDTLWSAIFEQRNITYFAETEQNLDEVLSIFVRLNSGGTPLSYSDLLLSLATATWKHHDAREQVYKLVDDLNQHYGAAFDFSKDFVLKTLLVLGDGDVRFKTTNIRRKLGLEDIWDSVDAALRITVRLLQRFGFDWHTLTAQNAVIPITYYLYKRSLGDGFVTQKQHEQEREELRTWLLKVLLGRAFGGQSDRVLTNVREVIRSALAAGETRFPADAILQDMAARQNFVFSEEGVEAIVSETTYGTSRAFAVLALLFPHLSYQLSAFHVDHLHPSARFTQRRLAAAGMSQEDINFALEHVNRLPNLQLLPDSENVGKQDTPLEQWLQNHSNPGLMRSMSMIPDMDLSLLGFRPFYQTRRRMLVAALKAQLGITRAQPQPEQLSPELFVTGEAVEI